VHRPFALFVEASVIRVGVVGFGLGGRVFHAPLISSVEGLELAAVVERTTNKAAERYPGITTYRSVADLLEDTSINLVVVTTPSGTHFEIARQVLEAGRHVVVDKPVCTTSAEVAQLMRLALARNLSLVPFHNRRWDGDFQTIRRIIGEGSLGRLVSFESRFDRWRPDIATKKLWKESVETGGGTLLDLGPHLTDQALTIFGKPEAVSAEVLRERDGTGSNDAFTIRLRYPGISVTVGANALSLPPGPRFHLRGTKGNYLKLGVDAQEAALTKIARIEDPAWGVEPTASWGTLYTGIDGGTISTPIRPVAGDYRVFYSGMRDALLGKAPVPVQANDAWRIARILEWAAESSERRSEVTCDWSEEPE
jgi:scyllo-inositol 2-dehydrogenase (NADP+)